MSTTIQISEIVKDYEKRKNSSDSYFTISLNHYIACEITEHRDFIRPIFNPIIFDEKKIIFTNYMFVDDNGDNIYLIIVDEKYKLLVNSYEPDCDGSYYTNHIIDIEEIDGKSVKLMDCYSDMLFKNLFITF